jgi:hypothetical protein
MSELAIAARAKAREKVERLTRSSNGTVDASGWKEPLGMQADVQTGPRVLSRRQFRRGGKVGGEDAKPHVGRKPRASGGMTSTEFINRDVKAANESRAGSKHLGGMKRGGKVHGDGCTCAKCGGGSVRRARAVGGPVSYGGSRPQGGRIARARGGRSKKGTNINIIIAPGGGGAKPPMPMPPPPGGPIGMRQGMPPPMPPPGAAPPMGPPPGGMPPPGLMRKDGGRAYPIKDGAGGGKGRLQKIAAYGP